MAQNSQPIMSGIGSPGKSTSAPHKPSGNSNLAKRLQLELMSLMSDSTLMDAGISAFPDEDNLFRWVGTINGPGDSPYEGMIFKLAIDFPEMYPYKPPNCQFKSGCWHPNVDMAGRICLDVLTEKWSASMDVRGLLLSLQSLLDDPNPASPLNAEAAQLWSENKPLYREKVKQHYEKIDGKLNKQ